MKLKKTTYTINSLRHIPDMPERMRFAVLADFHGGDPDMVLDILRKDVPDAILITGDLINGYFPEDDGLIVEDRQNLLPFLESCAGIAPSFMSIGNHECLLCEEDLDVIRSAGITVLDNEWTKFTTGSGSVLIGGLTSAYAVSYRKFRDSLNDSLEEDMPYERYPFRRRPKDILKRPTISGWLDEFEKQEGYKILLSHHPEYWSLREPMLRNRKIDLVLSGHAHGGQWQFMGRGILAPGQGFFPRFTHGVHYGPHGRMIVSRGLHNPFRYIPRWGNPCEAVYVEITNKPDRSE